MAGKEWPHGPVGAQVIILNDADELPLRLRAGEPRIAFPAPAARTAAWRRTLLA